MTSPAAAIPYKCKVTLPYSFLISSYPDQTGRSRAEFKNKPGTYVNIREITRYKYHTQFSIDDLNGPDGEIAFFQFFSALPSKPWFEFFWNAGDSYNYLSNTRCSRQHTFSEMHLGLKSRKKMKDAASSLFSKKDAKMLVFQILLKKDASFYKNSQKMLKRCYKDALNF